MSNPNESGSVSLNIQERIAIISFFHPSSNSLPGNLLKQLADTINEVGKKEEIRCIVLKSEGERAFCAGASFDELIAISNEEEGLQFFSGFANVINAMRKCPKFIVGRVQGKAVGGGVGLASAVDICYATKYASVKLSELAVGIGPFVVGPAVERKIGTSAMSQLAIDATSWQTAEWAKEKGLYANIFDDAQSMDDAINTFTKTLSNSNPQAMFELKKTFWQGTDNWDSLLIDRAKISGTLVLSEFTRNAIQQFKS